MSEFTAENQLNHKPLTKTTKRIISVGLNSKLTLLDAKLLAYKALPVSLTPDSYPAMEVSYQFLKECIQKRLPIYGINTHFLSLIHI